jgi:putative endonuclease
MEKTYYVYILASLSKVIYTGVSSQLEQRVWQHKNNQGSNFTKKYNVNRLVWYGDTNDPNIAIEWEKRIKGWIRIKKIKMIEDDNPNWDDLAENWF